MNRQKEDQEYYQQKEPQIKKEEETSNEIEAHDKSFDSNKRMCLRSLFL